MTIREQLERDEDLYLDILATKSHSSKGRLRPEPPCPIRPCFDRDRDRILHSKAFRRLKHKTQVFLTPEGDHYRTRLTHTLEVSQIARTISRALRLNEHLTEAIALGHDLGHTPFGHAGEAALNDLMPEGFSHEEQSLRVVDFLERHGQGLNLTHEVRDGIRRHSKGRGPILLGAKELPFTMEGQVVRASDIIAYANHDLDDAIRGGLLSEDRIPKDITAVIGSGHSLRIANMVSDLVTLSLKEKQIRLSAEMEGAIGALRVFLFREVYESDAVAGELGKVRKIIVDLWGFLLESLREGWCPISPFEAGEAPERSVCDFVACMSDRYALDLYLRLFLPQPWPIRRENLWPPSGNQDGQGFF